MLRGNYVLEIFITEEPGTEPETEEPETTEPETLPETEEPASGLPLPALIGIIAGGVAVLGGIVALIIALAKKK